MLYRVLTRDTALIADGESGGSILLLVNFRRNSECLPTAPAPISHPEFRTMPNEVMTFEKKRKMRCGLTADQTLSKIFDGNSETSHARVDFHTNGMSRNSEPGCRPFQQFDLTDFRDLGWRPSSNDVFVSSLARIPSQGNIRARKAWFPRGIASSSEVTPRPAALLFQCQCHTRRAMTISIRFDDSTNGGRRSFKCRCRTTKL